MKAKQMIIMAIITLGMIVNSGVTAEAAEKYVKSLTVPKKVTVTKGETKTVKVSVKANKKAAKKLNIKVKNSKIAKVKYNINKGTLTVRGKKAGSTKVTFTTKAKNKKGKKISKVMTINVLEYSDKDYSKQYDNNSKENRNNKNNSDNSNRNSEEIEDYDDYYSDENTDNNRNNGGNRNDSDDYSYRNRVENGRNTESRNTESRNTENGNTGNRNTESRNAENGNTGSRNTESSASGDKLTEDRTTAGNAKEGSEKEEKTTQSNVKEGSEREERKTEERGTEEKTSEDGSYGEKNEDRKGDEKTEGENQKEKIDISKVDVNVLLTRKSYIYSGEPNCPGVDVYCDGKRVTFDLEYENNVNAGEASAVITGTGDYCGTIKENFSISKKSWYIKLESLPASIFVDGTGEIKLKEEHGEMTYKVITEQNMSDILATVDEKGVIKGVKPGRVWVYASSKGDPNYEDVKSTYLGDVYVCNKEADLYGFCLKQWSTKARYKAISFPRNDDGTLEFSFTFQCDSAESWIDDNVTFEISDVTPKLIKQLFSDMNMESDEEMSLDISSKKPYYADKILSPVKNGVIEYSGRATGAKLIECKVGQQVRAAKIVAKKDGKVIDTLYVGGEQGAKADLELYKKVREKVEAKLWTNSMSKYAKLKAVSEYVNSTCHYPIYPGKGYMYQYYNPQLWDRLNVDGQDMFWGMFSDVTMNRILCFQGGIVDCQAASIITRVAREDLNIPSSQELINGTGEAVWLAVGSASSNPGSATHQTAVYRDASGNKYYIDTQGMLDNSSCKEHGCLDKIISLKD